MQAMKYASKEIHSGFETQGRCHQKYKTGVSVTPQKGLIFSKKNFYTRKHSSRMRTAHSLTVSRSIPCILGGGGFCPIFLKADHPHLDADPPCGQTNTCETITLPQTSFAGGKSLSLATTHRYPSPLFTHNLRPH